LPSYLSESKGKINICNKLALIFFNSFLYKYMDAQQEDLGLGGVTNTCFGNFNNPTGENEKTVR